MEDSILEIRENCEKIILVGDLNSKTKQADDFLVLNEHDHFDQLDGIFDNQMCLKKRVSKDMHEIDSFGVKLLNLCKIYNIQIANGRLGKDLGVGNFTTIHNSVIDYVIASPELFSSLNDFEILDFNPMLSDVHAPIIFTMPSNVQEPGLPRDVEKSSKIKWDDAKNDEYSENLSSEAITELKILLENFDENNFCSLEIDNFINKTNTILQEAKHKTFRPKPRHPSFKKTRKKAWYDNQLDRAKKSFAAARKGKNRANIRRQSKLYKGILASKFSNFQKNIREKLKATETKNPRFFWGF